MSVQEVKEAIKELSVEELDDLERFIADARYAAWDKQIEQDSDSGKLDALLNEAKASYNRGEATEI